MVNKMIDGDWKQLSEHVVHVDGRSMQVYNQDNGKQLEQGGSVSSSGQGESKVQSGIGTISAF